MEATSKFTRLMAVGGTVVDNGPCGCSTVGGCYMVFSSIGALSISLPSYIKLYLAKFCDMAQY